MTVAQGVQDHPPRSYTSNLCPECCHPAVTCWCSPRFIAPSTTINLSIQPPPLKRKRPKRKSSSTKREKTTRTATHQANVDLQSLCQRADNPILFDSTSTIIDSSATSSAATTLPCFSFDREQKYDLARFSSFANTGEQGIDGDSEWHDWREEQEQKEVQAELVGSRDEVDVVEATPMNVQKASTPKHARGSMCGGVGISVLMGVHGRKRAATGDSKSTPAPPTRLSNSRTSVNSPSSLEYSTFPARPKRNLSPSSSSDESDNETDDDGTSSTSASSFTSSSSSSSSSSFSSPSPPSSTESEQARRTLVESHLIAQNPLLSTFTFSHRTHIPGKPTTYIDSSRRSFATRIECPSSLSTVSSDLNLEIDKVTKGDGKPRSKFGGLKAVKSDGVRGSHEARQIGVHRELGCVDPTYSGQLRTQTNKWLRLMEDEAFGKARTHVSNCLETHYPLLYSYHGRLARLLAAYGLFFLFGAFASFCLNTGGKVSCLPHRDRHNLGPGLCGVMPFGQFDSSRSGWLILHEARLVIELGGGDVVLFPSAIFTHSNTSIHEDDERNSLAFWVGASLFLWQECGQKGLNKLSAEERAMLLAKSRGEWAKAWERFPVL